jgi:CBS-domain-containing membrane protein
MTPQVLYCYADEAAESVAANMARNQVRRLPVLDRSKRLVGIVALADISAHIEAQRTGDTVREISSPDIH